jgi:hypothetical protein
MSVKIVALLTMFFMSINGFLPKSITDLSGNSFLVDAVACQSVFLDFLRFSDKSLVEIAVKTVDDLSVSAPLSSSDNRATAAAPWAAVCRALAQSTDQVNMPGLADKAVPASSKQPAPASSTVDDTSSDFILLDNATRTNSGTSLVTAQLSGCLERAALYSAAAVCSDVGYPPRGIADRVWGLSGDVIAAQTARFSSYLPRSGIEASAMVKGIF